MSAGLDIGSTHALRSTSHNQYLKDGDPGYMGGGTITGTNTQPSLEMYENIFGPAGRDVKIDSQRHKRHQRWHLPDALKGHNQFLTDRIDGLITDATNSPFTRNILPYKYLENPDQKLKWNVYSFDEGIASRVPYEAAARVLPQTKKSFAGYTVRQGLAIAMEHNFMMSPAGRENFKNQLTQLVGSIQLTNDLDVHIALLQAPSHQRHMNERYHDQFKTSAQICREYVDLFGIMQKTTNALDHLIEDAKNTLKTWGSPPPTFLLCNGALTTQLTMIPEVTNYVTNGPDGKANLKKGPDLPSYRGLSIINSRKFSMDAGTAPRDLLRRRVRVGEYYHIVWNPRVPYMDFEFYDQSRDTMFRLSYKQLLDMSKMSSEKWTFQNKAFTFDNTPYWSITPPHNDKIPKLQNRAYNLENGGILLDPSPPTNDVSIDGTATQYTGAMFGGAPVALPNSQIDLTLHQPGQQGGLLFYPILQWHGGAYGGKYRIDGLQQTLTCSLPSFLCTAPDHPRYDVMSEAYGGGIFRHPFENSGVLKKFSEQQKEMMLEAGGLEAHPLLAKQGLFSPFANLCVPEATPDLRYYKFNNAGDATTWRGDVDTVERHRPFVMTDYYMNIMSKVRTEWLADFNEVDAVGIGSDLRIHSGVRGHGRLQSRNGRTYAGILFLALELCNECQRKTGRFEADIDFIKSLSNQERQNIIQKAMMHTVRNDDADPIGGGFLCNFLDTDGGGGLVVGTLRTGVAQYDAFRNTLEMMKTAITEFNTKAGNPLTFGAANALYTAPLPQVPDLLDAGNCRTFESHTRRIRALWSASVNAKFLTYWLCNLAGNNTIEPSNAPHMVEMFSEYKNKFADVVLNEFAFFMNASMVPALAPVPINEGVCNAHGAQVTSNCVRRKTLCHIGAGADYPKTAAGDIDYDSVSANLSVMTAMFDSDNYSRAHMPMPNLHLGTCSPLKADDAKWSASSMNSNMWVVQQVAGMTLLSEETCASLLKFDDNSAQSNTNAYRDFLLPSASTAMRTSAWNSFLMHWFMSYFHPSASVRENAKAMCNLTQNDKQELCEAINASLRQNSCAGVQLNKVLQKLAHPNVFTADNNRYSTAVASPDIDIVPAHFIKIDDTVNPSTFRKVAAQNAPVADVDGFNKVQNAGRGIDNARGQVLRARQTMCNTNSFVDVTGYSYDQLYNNEPDMKPMSGVTKDIYAYEEGVQPCDFDNSAYNWIANNTWTIALKNSALATHNMPCNIRDQSAVKDGIMRKSLCVSSDAMMMDYLVGAQGACRSPQEYDNILKHFVLVLFARFFENSTRFMFDGQGMGVPFKHDNNHVAVRNGLHFMHGPFVPTPLSAEDAGYGAKDIVILRPNIEHEMLGVIMGRGGTQELGCTFWGQTELSCYDDAQHGIWGMSYKYHERAMVTNEKNLIRVFDVAFDGYNGGMDQEAVDWNDFDSVRKFSQATYARDRPYTGPSMLVMALPHNPNVTRCNWPNPIVFHDNLDSDPSPDPQKDNKLPSVKEYMVFNSTECPKMCTKAQEAAYKAYMNRLGMHQWSSIDSSSRPAGELCINNEASTHMLAFQGTMKMYDQSGGLVEHIQGSGHLGPSYVGVASIREGRGLQNTGMAPSMIRQI